MGKQPQKTGNNRFKKEFNNYNPYNKLQLNKYHQLSSDKVHPKYGHQLHKKKRDIQRMLKYRQQKGLEIEEDKRQQLNKIEGQLEGRKKDFEKDQRKEHFLEAKYKQIMNIQKRKVAKKIRELKESSSTDKEEISLCYKQLNYIKYFPKNLKYVSLFPNTPLTQKALQFQQKIMNDIDTDLSKKKEKMNSFEPQYKKPQVKKQKRDDFFIQDIEENQQENQ